MDENKYFTNIINAYKEKGIKFINEKGIKEKLFREREYFIEKYISAFQKNYLKECYDEKFKFEFIYYLYETDSQLKSSLLKFFLIVENYLKTKLIFLLPELKNKIFKEELKRTEDRIKKLQNDKKERLVILIKKDFEKEHSKNLCDVEFNFEIFIGMFKIIRKFRNICAHNNILYNHREKDIKIKTTVFHKLLNLEVKNSFFDIVLILKFFLLKSEYVLLLYYLGGTLIYFDENIVEPYKKEIYNKMGFIDEKKGKEIIGLDKMLKNIENLRDKNFHEVASSFKNL